MSARLLVIATAPCFVGGARRRAGEEFSVARDDYIDYEGNLNLPSCVVPMKNRALANARIRELETRPLRAALAACGKSAREEAMRRIADLERDPNLEVKPRGPSRTAREQREVKQS
jgi:hypothetical protein